jgi:hypothetical protein
MKGSTMEKHQVGVITHGGGIDLRAAILSFACRGFSYCIKSGFTEIYAA